MDVHVVRGQPSLLSMDKKIELYQKYQRHESTIVELKAEYGIKSNRTIYKFFRQAHAELQRRKETVAK